MERIGNKISYIRKPMAKNGCIALALSGASLILSAAAVAYACRTRGNAPLFIAAVGFCGIAAAAVSVIYGILSFFEKDRNYLPSKIGLTVDGIVLLAWMIVVLPAL